MRIYGSFLISVSLQDFDFKLLNHLWYGHLCQLRDPWLMENLCLAAVVICNKESFNRNYMQ